MIDWSKCSSTDTFAVRQIVKRARIIDPCLDPLDTAMDLEACHACGCPLDLKRMATAAESDLMHDVHGISQYIDRESGELDGFVPRLRADPEPLTKEDGDGKQLEND